MSLHWKLSLRTPNVLEDGEGRNGERGGRGTGEEGGEGTGVEMDRVVGNVKSPVALAISLET